MKRVYMICLTIMSCILFSGCELILGGVVAGLAVSKQNLDKAKHKATLNYTNATMACYQLSGALEAKYEIKYRDNSKTKEREWEEINLEIFDDKFMALGYSFEELMDKTIEKQIAEKAGNKLNQLYTNAGFTDRRNISKNRASKNGTQEQVNQCLKSLKVIKSDKHNQCENDDTDCYNEASESYIAFIKSLEPKLKNVKFSCSQEYEVFEEFGPKFDKDIESYALDLIEFNIISKNVVESIDKANLVKELKQYDIDSNIIQSTLDNLKNNSLCMYKMKYYDGVLNKLDGFKRSGILASKISKGYNSFTQRIEQIKEKLIGLYNDRLKKTINGQINNATKNKITDDELAEWIAIKYKYEAMIKFLEEK